MYIIQMEDLIIYVTLSDIGIGICSTDLSLRWTMLIFVNLHVHVCNY